LALVTEVYSRLRCSISHALIVRATTTQGYSLPWGTVDADRIGMGQLIQLIEAVADLLVLVQQHPELLVLQRERGHDPDRAPAESLS
jgi:hypothetical protein